MWQGYYNAACFEALTGNDGAAIEQLKRAVELDPKALEYARGRLRLRPLRDRPDFPSSSGSAHISDLALRLGRGPSWAMVRTHFGIQSFGVNAWVADEPGSGSSRTTTSWASAPGDTRSSTSSRVAARLSPSTATRSTRLQARSSSCAIRQRSARLSRRGRDDDRRRRRQARRGFHALSLGRGNADGLRHFATKDYDKAAETFEKLLDESPGDAGFLYNLACAESLLGHKEAR